MDGNRSVIEILDSPEVTGTKRKRDHGDSSENDYNVGAAPKHPLLDSITSRFEQNRADREEKNALLRSKREIEKVHSNYLKQNLDHQELARANYAASYWAKKNGIKDTASALSTVPSQSGRPPGNEAKKRQKKKKKKKASSTNTDASANSRSWLDTSDNDFSPPENVALLSLRNKAGETAQVLGSAASASSEGKYICPVLFCDAEFSSEGSLGQHMNLFKHSPCNPLRLAEDTKLLPDPVCFKCPECDLEFESKDLCREHMDRENHLVFYPPLAITAYQCPDCLYLFKNLQSCLSHMESSRHYSFKFPFKDDVTDGDFNLPVALAEEFVQDYIKECKKIPFQVQCLECSMFILSPADLKQHPNFHRVCVLTDNDLADVFSTYIKTFSCDRCHRLFDEQPAGDPRHICAGGIVGNIKANLVNTTSEFLKYSALSLIPSVKGKKAHNGLMHIGKVKQTIKHDPVATLNGHAFRTEDDYLNLNDEDSYLDLKDQALERDISSKSKMSNGANDKSQPSKGGVEESPRKKSGFDSPGSSRHLVNEKLKALKGALDDSPRTRLSRSLHDLDIDSESDCVVDTKTEQWDSSKELGQKVDLAKKIKQEVQKTLPCVALKKESTSAPICRDKVKEEVHETTCGVNVKKEMTTEPLHHNVIKLEVQERRPGVTVKKEGTTETVNQEVKETGPDVTVKNEGATETLHLERVKQEVQGAQQYNIKEEIPSTSTGIVSGTQDFGTSSNDSDSDLEFIEISDPDGSVDRILISDSDSVVEDDQKNTKPQSGMVISPSKKKRKKKRKQGKKMTKKQRRLAEEEAKVSACEKLLKFLNKEEKKKDEDTECRRMPTRQAKAVANNMLERKKKRALGMLEQQKIKKAEREQQQIKKAERIEAKREQQRFINAERIEAKREQQRIKNAERKEAARQEEIEKRAALKEAALRDDSNFKSYQSGAHGSNVAFKGTVSRPISTKQLKNPELFLNTQDVNLISTENLKKKRNIIFLDLDNFSTFFRVLPHSPPEDMFVWAFYGGKFNFGQKTLNEIYFEMKQNGQVYISDRCGQTKDAADFALVLTVGKMDERLPSNVSFTIVSADKGFCEVERQMQQSSRSARVINPKQDTDLLLPILRSLVDM